MECLILQRWQDFSIGRAHIWNIITIIQINILELHLSFSILCLQQMLS